MPEEAKVLLLEEEVVVVVREEKWPVDGLVSSREE